MRLLKTPLVFLLLASAGSAQELTAWPLVDSMRYDKAKADAEILARIQAGVYDGYAAELGVDDPEVCKAKVFDPYKTKRNGETVYQLKVNRAAWPTLPPDVQQAAVREITWFTWGHKSKPYPPLDVRLRGAEHASPLDRLSPQTAKRYLRFSPREAFVGGTGGDAYGPNGWYSAVSAVADRRADYARKKELGEATWDKARFMGPVEFRFHMRQFEPVKGKPEFGDVLRYYLDDPIYSPDDCVFGGEIHAAVFVGKEEYTGRDGKPVVREIVLTKNCRGEFDFLVFQDAKALDEAHLKKLADDHPLRTRYKGRDPRKKGYFRVKPKAQILDPAVVGKGSAAYAAYVVDQVNFQDRWDCLAGKIPPPHGEHSDAYDYPLRWLKLDVAE